MLSPAPYVRLLRSLVASRRPPAAWRPRERQQERAVDAEAQVLGEHVEAQPAGLAEAQPPAVAERHAVGALPAGGVEAQHRAAAAHERGEAAQREVVDDRRAVVLHAEPRVLGGALGDVQPVVQVAHSAVGAAVGQVEALELDAAAEDHAEAAAVEQRVVEAERVVPAHLLGGRG
jgi:hypothetical protein